MIVSAPPPEHVVALALEDERGAEDPEERTRCADRRRPGCGQEQRAGRTCEPGHDVDEREARAPDRLLHRCGDPPEEEHVHPEVDHAGVEEHRREETPPVAVRDEEAVQRAVQVRIAVGVRERAAAADLPQEHGHVDPDQDLREQRARALDPEAFCALDDLGRPGRHAGVLGALDPDRREDHAVRAQPAPAVGAGDARLAVRVPVARQACRHRRLAYPGCVSTSPSRRRRRRPPLSGSSSTSSVPPRRSRRPSRADGHASSAHPGSRRRRRCESSSAKGCSAESVSVSASRASTSAPRRASSSTEVTCR